MKKQFPVIAVIALSATLMGCGKKEEPVVPAMPKVEQPAPTAQPSQPAVTEKAPAVPQPVTAADTMKEAVTQVKSAIVEQAVSQIKTQLAEQASKVLPGVVPGTTTDAQNSTTSAAAAASAAAVQVSNVVEKAISDAQKSLPTLPKLGQ